MKQPTIRLASGLAAALGSLILAGATTARVVWAQTTFTERVLSSNAPQAAGVVVADIDGDGDADAVTAEYAINTVAWYENSGASPPAWTKHVVDGSASGPITVAVGDLDGDGDLDGIGA